MALKDCIKLLETVTDEDVALLESYMAEGLSDQQAVQRLLVESSVDVISIANRARAEGAEIKVPKDTVAEIRDLQDAKLRKLLGQRLELEERLNENGAAYIDMSQNEEIIEDAIEKYTGERVAIADLSEADATMRFGQVLFNEEMRSGLKRGVLGIQGTKPHEVYESWQAQHEAMIANRKEHVQLLAEHQQINADIQLVMGGPTQTYDQTVFHGTPHAFDEFSMEKIGTGEGVQAYGYGLYFAESKEVASYYTQSNDVASIVANSQLVKFKGDRQAAIEHLKSGKSDFSGPVVKRATKILEGKADELDGHVYEIEVDDAAVEQMLDWDAPLSEHPESVRDALQNVLDDIVNTESDYHRASEFARRFSVEKMADTPAEDLYRTLSSLTGGDEKVSLALREAGIPGIKFLDASSRTSGVRSGKTGFLGALKDAVKGKSTHNMVLFSTDSISQVKRDGEVTFERGKYEQSKRGFISFDDNGRAVIGLLEAADFSTFIHEAGHLYLNLMGELAGLPEASAQVMQDYSTVLKYLGVKGPSEITTEHHELFARSFERYAMEGKAPSIALQDAFNAFRRWLGEIYRRIAGVRDIELPAEISDVMDRMLATDLEIQLAKDQQEFAALFTSAEQMGISEEAFEVYKRSLIREHDEAVQAETVRMLAEIKRDETAMYKQERQKVEEKVAKEVHGMKVYRAIAMLTRGKQPNGQATRMAPFKLDRQSLLDLFQGDTESLKLLPHTGQHGIYRKKDGADVDVAAQALGYIDGRALIDAMLKAPDMKAVIESETQRRMNQIYPDPFKDGTLAENAVRRVHNERRAQILGKEMRQLRKRMREDKKIVSATKKQAARETRQAREANRGILPQRAEVAMIKAAAQQSIGQKRVRDVNPNTYLNAERKAGRLAFEAAAKNDFQKAFLHKRQQLINHEMYRAAVRAKERSGKTQKYLTKFESKRVQARLGRSDVLDKILSVLEGVDFRRRSLTKVDQQKLENELREAVNPSDPDTPPTLIMPPGVLERIFDDRINWQDLKVDELEAMRDLIKQLEQQARGEVEAIVNGEKVNIQNAASEVALQITENNKVIPALTSEKTKWEGTKDSLKQGVSTWLRPSSIARVLDQSGFGAITRRIIVPMRRAYAEKLIPNLHLAQAEVAAMYRDHFNDEQMSNLNKRNIRIEAQNESYSHGDLLSMGLNQGNEYNRKAIKDGIKRDGNVAYNEAGINQMLAQLTENDWAFIQSVWDYLDTYWNDVKDENGNVIREGLSTVERRRRGISAKQVEPSAFTIRTADGKEVSLRGGYYPMKYSREHSDSVKVMEYNDYYEFATSGNAVTASTRAGATYERTSSGKKVVRLGLNVLDTHLREVVRDISIGDEVNYLKRVLNSGDVKNAFHSTGNEAMLDTLGLWLADSAVGEMPAQTMVQRAVAWVRTGFTKSKLGYNLMTTALQFTGFAQSMAVLGSRHMAVGLYKVIVNPPGAYEKAMSESRFLNTRYEVGAWDKDVQDARNHVHSMIPTKYRRITTTLNHSLFVPIAKAQQVVDVTTWLAAKEKGLTELGLSNSDAILYADTQVEASQTSGFFSDRSGLERGTLGKTRQEQFIRIWTTLISYMLAKGNIAYEKSVHLKRDGNWKKPSEVVKYAADMTLLFVIEGMASALLYSDLPEDDDPEDIAAWAAWRTLESMAAGVPFIRDVPGARFSSGTTPVGNLGNSIWDLGIQSGQGEADEAMRKALYDVLGTLAHLPTGQLGRTMEAIWFEDDPELWEYISGVRDE